MAFTGISPIRSMVSKLKLPPEGAALLGMVQASLAETPAPAENFPPSLDWIFLERLAGHHRLEPLLWYGLNRSRYTGIPAAVRQRWEASRRRAVARMLHHQDALRAVAAAFEERRIAFILLKGEALSKALYPHDGLRPYADIDLLIRPEGYDPAKAVLTKLGFRLRQTAKEEEKLRLFGEIEFDRKDPIPLTVDLHWDTLMTSWEPRSLFGEHETWASIDHVQLGDQVIPVLSGELLLVYLCVHLAFHHVFDGLLLLCDLFLLLRRDAERIDWDRLKDIADRCQCRNALFYSLSYVKTLMAGEVPPGILDRLRPPAIIRVLMPSNRLLFRDALAPQALERYVKLLLIDTNAGRRRAFRAWFRSSKLVLRRQSSSAR